MLIRIKNKKTFLTSVKKTMSSLQEDYELSIAYLHELITTNSITSKEYIEALKAINEEAKLIITHQ